MGYPSIISVRNPPKTYKIAKHTSNQHYYGFPKGNKPEGQVSGTWNRSLFDPIHNTVRYYSKVKTGQGSTKESFNGPLK